MENTIAYPTPHIGATPADFAPTVLMPGDPLRAKFIAEHYLERAVLVNNIRGIQGYTGYYGDTRVSVMASGMGIPSIGIYATELYAAFGVENIIRIGSCGSIADHVHVRDLVLALGASTDSAFLTQYALPGTFAPTADYTLLSAAARTAQKRGAVYHVGSLLSSDRYYDDDESALGRWAKMGILAVDMEAAGLYAVAARRKKRALAICTVSNHILTGEETTAKEREESFTAMMETALGVAVLMEKEKHEN